MLRSLTRKQFHYNAIDVLGFTFLVLGVDKAFETHWVHAAVDIAVWLVLLGVSAALTIWASRNRVTR